MRLSQPKRAAPWVRHSRRARVENGRPLPIGLVAQAQFDRIDADGVRQLVHRALEREMPLRFHRRSAQHDGCVAFAWTTLSLVEIPPLPRATDRFSPSPHIST